MTAPSSQQRIDEDVEVLAEVVATFDYIAAVTIDPDGEVRLDDSVLVEDERPLGEVADPKRIAVIARPAATDRRRERCFR
jgi:hypothetical protein